MRSPAGRATIREVARLAGVSVGTVSNVINGRARVRPETRAAVERAVAELGFAPHAVARMLIARRSRDVWSGLPAGTPRLTTVGFVSTDYTARIQTLPHREDRSVARTIDKTLGGPAANVAVAAADLGAPMPVAAEVLTVIGDDPDSDWAVSRLAGRGVQIVALGSRDGRRLARAMIMVEASGARTILYEAVDFPDAEVARFLKRRGPAAGRHAVHWQASVVPPRHTAARIARELGYVTSVQTSGMPARDLGAAHIAGLVRDHDVTFLNRDAARIATDWQGGAEELQRRVGLLSAAHPERLIVLTLAESGAVLFAAGAPSPVPAPHVEPVDATGAGDSFAGAFLAAWLNGAAPADATRTAVLAASLSVTFPGAQETRITAAQLAVAAEPAAA